MKDKTGVRYTRGTFYYKYKYYKIPVVLCIPLVDNSPQWTSPLCLRPIMLPKMLKCSPVCWSTDQCILTLTGASPGASELQALKRWLTNDNKNTTGTAMNTILHFLDRAMMVIVSILPLVLGCSICVAWTFFAGRCSQGPPTP